MLRKLLLLGILIVAERGDASYLAEEAARVQRQDGARRQIAGNVPNAGRPQPRGFRPNRLGRTRNEDEQPNRSAGHDDDDDDADAEIGDLGPESVVANFLERRYPTVDAGGGTHPPDAAFDGGDSAERRRRPEPESKGAGGGPDAGLGSDAGGSRPASASASAESGRRGPYRQQNGGGQSWTTVRPPANRIFFETLIPQAACIQSCPSVNHHDPVCGTDNITYRNRAKFVCAQRCGRVVSERHPGVCFNAGTGFRP